MLVVITTPAQQRMDALPDRLRERLCKKIMLLRSHAYEGKKLQGELHGLYAARVWPFRIIYEIRKREGLIVIHRIEDRKDVYR